MTRILNEKDIRAVLTGAAFFGAGGGGSLKTALEILAAKTADGKELSVKLIDAAEISVGGSAAAMTGYYQADALAAKTEKFVREPALTATAMQQSAYMAGKRLEAILPMDLGAVTNLFTLLCSIDSGLPVVDADGCGRGVPAIDVTLFEKGNIAFSPAVLCDDRGNSIRVYPYQATSGKAAENLCHYLCGGFNNVSGLAAWITNPDDINAKLIPGSVSAAENVGKAILAAVESGSCVCEALEKALPLKILATGKVEEKAETVVKIAGDDGAAYFADIAKVTTRFRTADAELAVCPDLICAVDLETGMPIANEELAVGQKVRYYALSAPEQWQGHTECWKPYL